MAGMKHKQFDVRLPRELNQIFEKLETKENEQIIISKRDSQIFFKAIMNPKKPSKILKKALDSYNAFTLT